MRHAKEALMTKSIQEIRAMLAGLGAPMQSRSKEELVNRYIAIVDMNDAQIKKSQEPVKVKEPVKVITEGRVDEIKALLQSHISRGVNLSFTSPTVWKMQRGGLIDSGHVSTPDNIIVRCADAILRG